MRSPLTAFLVLIGLCWVFPQGPSLLFAQDAGGKPPAVEGKAEDRNKKPQDAKPKKPAGVPLRRWGHLSWEEKKELEKHC